MKTRLNCYKIVRYFSDLREPKIIKHVDTVEQARKHCSRKSTCGILKNGVQWFDGFLRTAKYRQGVK